LKLQKKCSVANINVIAHGMAHPRARHHALISDPAKPPAGKRWQSDVRRDEAG
jgi:hypothetical protein